MIKHATHRLTLALALAVLAIPAGRVFAQSSVVATPDAVTGTDPEPQVKAATPDGVTGTDPEPQGDDIETILALLDLT
jgi:hypothetical protein